MTWAHKVVMITGASSGIGRGLALNLARRGAYLGLLARRQDQLDQLVEQVRSAGGEAIAFAVDVQDADAVREAGRNLQAQFGSINVLIANAGIGINTNPEALSTDDFARVLHVNVLGAVNSVAAAVPHMIQQGSG